MVGMSKQRAWTKWEYAADLRFPDIIAATTLRPDMVLMSRTSKQVVLRELTVPWEDWMEKAQERNKAKSADLVAECQKNGWKTHCEPSASQASLYIGSWDS